MFTKIRILALSALVCLCWLVPASAAEEEFVPPNYVPELSLSYLDPVSGERVWCEENCRRFEAPAGVDLEITVRTKNEGTDLDQQGVPLDLFFDQRHHPFPGLEVADCQDGSGEIGVECWSDLVRRVDWEKWNALVADRVCVPEKPGECAEVTVRLTMDENFAGTRGRGVYSIAVWADRFQLTPERDEFDNFLGPVRVKVIPREEGSAVADAQASGEEAEVADALVVAPTVPMPYSFRTAPKKLEKAFNLSSPSSRAVIAFLPPFAGEVNVEVLTGRSFSKLVVQVQDFSTEKVLVETIGEGQTYLQGNLTQGDLKNDRRIVVTLKLDQGARPTRGTLTVRYPERPIYRRQ